MRAKDDRRLSGIAAVAGGLVVFGCLLYLLVRAVTGYDLADTLTSPGEDVVVRDRATLWPWIAAALLGAGALTFAWLRDRATAKGRTSAEARAHAAEAERDALRDKLAHERDRLRDEVSTE